MTFAIHPGSLAEALEDALSRLADRQFADAIWTRRLDVWTSDASVQTLIANRLGWLDAPAAMGAHLPRVRALAQSVMQDGTTDVILLGMGGSSLAADVLRATSDSVPGYPRFHVLDSIDPDAVRPAMERAATSVFIVASKSGSTVEVASLAAEAERRVRSAGVATPGSHFIAITDPGTSLQRLAAERQYRDVFVNPADIGGRYSALSLFGLVPAALMGMDLEGFATSAMLMAQACRSADPEANPGLALGAFMAAGALSGQDKMMAVLPERFDRLGLWIEQLVAESTGKHGRGVVPVVTDDPAELSGDDCVVLEMTIGDTTGQSRLRDELPADTPHAFIGVSSTRAIGGEFFRWEFATATAGLLLEVNPFDEPNVQQAKDATRTLLAVHQSQGALPDRVVDASIDGLTLTLSAEARTLLGDRGPAAFLDLVDPGDYFALLAYLPPEDPSFAPILSSLRAEASERAGCAATLGYGPRYLHSTGQLHKGGPNTGVFLIVTATPDEDFPVPDQVYPFGVLEQAQAAGDFAALDAAGRRALLVHLPRRDPKLVQRLRDILLGTS